MSPAKISIAALLLIIIFSRWERVNVGILAMGAAGIIGFYGAGMGMIEIMRAFPL